MSSFASYDARASCRDKCICLPPRTVILITSINFNQTAFMSDKSYVCSQHSVDAYSHSGFLQAITILHPYKCKCAVSLGTRSMMSVIHSYRIPSATVTMVIPRTPLTHIALVILEPQEVVRPCIYKYVCRLYRDVVQIGRLYAQ